ncbi:Uma2 family endonuclease [Aquabacterium sp. A7-Y]|uniref:Uma2 family endonuclease n=1 Tax=Aquabacterium sp. A7-Y TaxID=1349605 RepID=UPI00223DB3A5|nr:Uma2 family endonuclease [Aquabacterium sp. A7-Y]MCW7537616.1 Uma2 family endonuclease [Aquabacterium sp. A7-Y]
MGLPLKKLSPAEYLAWEEEQPERYEYVDGEIFAMVGSRRTHGRVVMNLSRHLGNHLEGGRCQVFSESMKLHIGKATYVYPDIFVTCDPADLATERFFRSPILIVEVLSSSTQDHDRNGKFALYRRLATLREYALVDPDTQRVEVFRLGADGLWDLHDQTDGGRLMLASVDFELPLGRLFDGVTPSAV